MTTGLDTAQAPVAGESTRKSRRGTETRRRTKHMTLRLLPQEQEVAEAVASQFDMKSVQALIVDVCQPLMSPGALDALAADRDALQDLARTRNHRSAGTTAACADFIGTGGLLTGIAVIRQ